MTIVDQKCEGPCTPKYFTERQETGESEHIRSLPTVIKKMPLEELWGGLTWDLLQPPQPHVTAKKNKQKKLGVKSAGESTLDKI